MNFSAKGDIKDDSEEPIDQAIEDSDEELYEHFRLQVDKGQGPVRLDKFLTDKLPNASRNRIQNATKSGNVLVNSLPGKNNYLVKPNDLITIVLPHPPHETDLKGEDIPLDIIYEDEYLLIVNKPAGMVVHPGFNNYTGTLVNALIFHFNNLPTNNGDRRPGLVHRIDKNTSGLLIISKDEFAMTHLARQFYEHSVSRTYHAIVWGNIDPEFGTVRNVIGRSPSDRKVMAVLREDKEDQGKLAVTHYRTLEAFPYASLVEYKLETGRTHQIRIHSKSLGHPLFNDSTYGGSDIIYGPKFVKYKQFILNCFKACPRHALHAMTIGFTHPYTGKRMEFSQPYPEDFASLLLKWQEATKSFKWDNQEQQATYELD
jgi:23S rRNA pseudouridine1911/1915/1917 synthase